MAGKLKPKLLVHPSMARAVLSPGDAERLQVVGGLN